MIRYLAGGRFGDFIHSLSVVNEKYLQTGHKGIVYLSEAWSEFASGLETTYRDTKDIILRQDYIHSYSIHNGEEYDVDLSEWRNCDYISRSYPFTMYDYYNVYWGCNKWLCHIPQDHKWHDKIVVWTIESRFPYSLKWGRFFEMERKCVFISYKKQDYDYFCSKTFLRMPFYQLQSFDEMCVILNSCQCFVGSYSGFLSVAFALHTKCFIGEFGDNELFARDFDKVLPDVHIDFYRNY